MKTEEKNKNIFMYIKDQGLQTNCIFQCYYRSELNEHDLKD